MPEFAIPIFAFLSRIAANFGADLQHYHMQLVIRFGEQVTMLIYLCAIFLVLLIFFKVFKLAFNLLRFVVIPSLVVAYVASTFFSLSLMAAIPMAGAGFSFLYLLKA